MGNKTKTDTKTKKVKIKIPKTVQQSIPYESVYPNGIIEVKPGYFSKSYFFGDVNFRTEDEEKQESMFIDYGVLLNKFPHNITSQITIFNRSTDINEVKNDILLKPQKDNFYDLRDEMNGILLSKMSEGRNNLKKERYLTVTVKAEDIEAAMLVFNNLDIEIPDAIKAINKTGARPLSIQERLNILYEVYNMNSPLPFDKKTKGFMDSGEFDLKKLNRGGLTSKDLIGCECINVARDYIRLGDVYARSILLDNLPTFLNTNVLTDLTDIPCNMVTSVIYRTWPQKKSIKLIKNQVTNINAEVIKSEKNATKGGYNPDLISPELKRSREEAEALLSDITSRNQKVFFVTVVMTIFADTLEDLNQKTELLQSKATDFMCQAKRLTGNQMAGFNSSLPLGTLYLDIDRVLTTESASVFIPFSMQELMDSHGNYYGLNALSKNMVLYNRGESKLPNGLILGQSGSGKSFIAKLEMLSTFLGSNDDIIIVDPESEYSALARQLGGQVIKITNGTNTHINPLDMDINYADESDPIAMKCDFLTAICETIVGKTIGLTPYDINIIHKVGRKIYEPYLQHMNSIKNSGVTCDRSMAPTLIDFYDELTKQPEPEARQLSMSMELYCVGNYDVFAHRTNINVDSRFLVYDIKDIGTGNKELGMQICLNDIWNRIIENRKNGKRTWIYLDEFYLLTKTERSASLLQEYYKRSRKWNGVITGITQDVEDLLITPEAKGIFTNSGFILMMNQSPIGRGELANLYQISSSLLGFITDKPPGTGLLYNGSSIIPFENKFPQDTKIYKVLSTKPTDDLA